LDEGEVKGKRGWRGTGEKEHLERALIHIVRRLAIIEGKRKPDDEDDLARAFCRSMMACAVRQDKKL